MMNCDNCGRDITKPPTGMHCEKCKFWLDTGDAEESEESEEAKDANQALDRDSLSQTIAARRAFRKAFLKSANALGDEAYYDSYVGYLIIKAAMESFIIAEQIYLFEEDPEKAQSMTKLIEALRPIARNLEGIHS